MPVREDEFGLDRCRPCGEPFVDLAARSGTAGPPPSITVGEGLLPADVSVIVDGVPRGTTTSCVPSVTDDDGPAGFSGGAAEASGGIRTHDLILTKEALYP